MKRQIRTNIPLVASLCLAAGIIASQAADKTWDAGGDQSSWSGSPANWDLDIDPVANDRLFFGGTVGLSPNNNFPADTDFTGIIFNAGADPFTISGNEIDLAANSGITNLSANVQTISANIDNNGANKVHSALTGDLVYTGVLRNNSIIKEGSFSLTTSGPVGNSAPGLTINEGTVISAKSAGNAFAGNFVVQTNGTFRLVSAGTHTDQIHFNTRINMNGGKFQMQHVDSVNTTRLEEVASLSGSNLASIVECGLAASTNTFRIGGGSGHRAIYSGTLRDGAAGMLNLEVYRANNFQQLNGTNTYTGVTLVNNSQAAGAARLIVNGQHTGGGDYTVNGHATDATRIAYLHGNGVISASVINFNLNSLLSPGGSLSADLLDSATFSDSTAILTISNAVNLNTATSTLDIQLNGTTAGSTYDQVVIAGSGTISNNLSNLKVTLGYTPASGDKFTIVNVEGTDSAKTIGTFASFNGVGTSVAQGAIIVDPNTGQSFRISYRAEGSTFDMGAGLGNNIMLEAISPVGGAVLTWRGDVDNTWDIIGTLNWRDTNNVASTFTNADFITFNNAGSNANPINLTTDLNPATVLFNTTNNVELGGVGKLTGLVIITKTNTGKLTVTTDNDSVGALLHRQGTVQIGTNGTTGKLSGNVNMSAGTTLLFDRSDSTTFAGVISGTGTVGNYGTNGTLILTGNNPFTGGVQAYAGTLQFGDGTGVSGSIAGRITNNATVTYNFNDAVTINNSLSGNGVVNLTTTSASSKRYTFPTTLVNHPFSGTFDVGPLVCLGTTDGATGTNQFGVGSTVYVQDTGSVLLDRFGTYRTTFYIQGAGNGAGNASTPVCLELEQGSIITSNVYVLSSTTIGGFLGDVRISGQLVDTNGTSTITFANGRANATSFNMQLGSAAGPNHWGETIIDPDLALGQIVRVTAMTANAISTNGLSIGAHGILALNGNNHTFANVKSTSLDGAFTPRVFNNNATTPAVFTVGTDDSSTTFDGVFGNGAAASLGVTKVGTGTLSLSGGSSNTGPVTVSGGVIALTSEGSFSNAATINIGSAGVLDVVARTDGNLNLNSGQTLMGNGGLNGNLVTLPGSTVNPGASIGTLTVSNNATLNGNLLMEVSTPNNSDALNVVGTLTAGGSLTVTNIGAALQANDTFQLFASGVSGFTVNLPTYDIPNTRQYTWQTNITTLGSVKVLTSAAIAPPTLGVVQSGNSLTFSWTGPFKLQSQTNSLSVGITSTWGNYPGGSSSPVVVTVNPANPTVFYRLSLQ